MNHENHFFFRPPAWASDLSASLVPAWARVTSGVSGKLREERHTQPGRSGSDRSRGGPPNLVDAEVSVQSPHPNPNDHFKHVSGLAGLGEHVFITAIGLNQRMFWLK